MFTSRGKADISEMIVLQREPVGAHAMLGMAAVKTGVPIDFATVSCNVTLLMAVAPGFESVIVYVNGVLHA
jgi:hypothetical protein